MRSPPSLSFGNALARTAVGAASTWPAPAPQYRSACASAFASGSSPGFGTHLRTRRRLAAAAIVALHGLLLWGLASYGVARDMAARAPPLLVQLLTPAAAERPRPVASLLLPPETRLPDPPAWVPPPEVRVLAPREPAINLQPVTPPPADSVVVAKVEPTVAVPVPSPAAVAPASLVSPPVSPPVSQPQTAASQLLPSSALRFTQAPVVEYPHASRRNKENGVVKVRAWVGAAGGASPDVRVEQSSGFVRLDQAAVRAVQSARFAPTVLDGRAVEGWATVPITFALES